MGSRGHIGLGSPPGTGDNIEFMPYWPHMGVDGMGEKDMEAISVTDFVGVGIVRHEGAVYVGGGATCGGKGIASAPPKAFDSTLLFCGWTKSSANGSLLRCCFEES